MLVSDVLHHAAGGRDFLGNFRFEASSAGCAVDDRASAEVFAVAAPSAVVTRLKAFFRNGLEVIFTLDFPQ
jgi:hypothetical protein